MLSPRNVATPEIRIELKNQFANAVLLKRFSKLVIPNSFGISDVELNVPAGFKAADVTNRTGMTAKTHARRATTCRQPTAPNQFCPLIG
jgi:hypothetical protein